MKSLSTTPLLEDMYLVICTRNRPGPLRNLLANLAGCEVLPSQLIIVDSSETPLSDEDQLKISVQLDPSFHYLKSEPGLPYQRNVAISFISHSLTPPKIVAFLDDDVEVPANYFSKASNLLKKYKELVGIGAFDMNHGGNKDNLVRRLLLLSAPKSGGSLLSSGIATIRKPQLEMEQTTWMPGHSVFFRWPELKVTRFDESVRMYGEDVEMQLRISKLGKIALSQDLWVSHIPSPLNRDQIRSISAYSDGFRWRLAQDYPERVSFAKVFLSTFALLVGELAKGLITLNLDSLRSAQGHIDFFIRAISKKETQQLRKS